MGQSTLSKSSRSSNSHPKPSLHRNQPHVLGRCLQVVVQSGQRQGRHRAFVHDRPENIVDRLAQFSTP